MPNSKARRENIEKTPTLGIPGSNFLLKKILYLDFWVYEGKNSFEEIYFLQDSFFLSVFITEDLPTFG